MEGDNIMADNSHEIDFRVPLSGSQLFDIHAYATAKNLCAKFPGLSYEAAQKEIHIFGTLNDYWFNEWNKSLFNIGS